MTHFFKTLIIAAFFFDSPVWSAETLLKPEGTCVRSFIYQNKSYPVDSNRTQDAEGLRFLLKKNTEAERLLNDYQSRKSSLLLPAYTGTFGIVAMLGGGLLYANSKSSDLGKRDTRIAFFGAGGLIVIGSYIYGKLLLSAKEGKLEDAISRYNSNVPQGEKIQVDLVPVSTGFGGEIKTIVPF